MFWLWCFYKKSRYNTIVILIHWLLSSVRGHPSRPSSESVCSAGVLGSKNTSWKGIWGTRDSLFSFGACIFRYESVVILFTNMELFSSFNTDGETFSWVIFNHREILGLSTKLQGFRTYLEWRHILKGGTFSKRLFQTACIPHTYVAACRCGFQHSKTRSFSRSNSGTCAMHRSPWQPGGTVDGSEIWLTHQLR